MTFLQKLYENQQQEMIKLLKAKGLDFHSLEEKSDLTHTWGKLEFALSCIDLLIEECIEFKRTIPHRKWWSDSKPYNKEELLSELADIMIALFSVMVFLELTPMDLINAVSAKVRYNKTRKDHNR